MQVLPRLSQSFAHELPELVVEWDPADFPDPRVVALNENLATRFGFDPNALRQDPSLLLPSGSDHAPKTVAMAYSGHQFGVYSPRLGDGRALLLGEVHPEGGEGLYDIHLKGSGRTPFARGGDGLAPLGPMLREYVVSEAMAALGIPTSRSLAVIDTGLAVRRETSLPGAVLVRVASSHIRFGTFQLARANEDVLRRLADYAIARHYPHLKGDYLGFYSEVMKAQARLVAQWMGVGFIHGVMNTDNAMVSGETIDYGPCAFLDTYKPEAVFSSIDHGGRYSYRNQPAIAQWNLARFGEALLPLIQDNDAAQEALSTFPHTYELAWREVLLTKLGLPSTHDPSVASELLDLMESEELDFTSSFRALTDGVPPSDSQAMTAWFTDWKNLSPNREVMATHNPVYIPRNFPLQQALNEAEQGDLSGFHQMVSLVSSPFTPRDGVGEFTESTPVGFQTFCGT
ncbi:MAG TPA: YdiU family protein [Beutenbergiaceae bacterium]|nr:YdiU family protein [Beutenbergiaceae bacterium]